MRELGDAAAFQYRIYGVVKIVEDDAAQKRGL